MLLILLRVFLYFFYPNIFQNNPEKYIQMWKKTRFLMHENLQFKNQWSINYIICGRLTETLPDSYSKKSSRINCVWGVWSWYFFSLVFGPLLIFKWQRFPNVKINWMDTYCLLGKACYCLFIHSRYGCSCFALCHDMPT